MGADVRKSFWMLGQWTNPVLWGALLLALAVGMVGCGTRPDLDFREGVRDLKWESGPGEHTGLVSVGAEGHLEFFRKEREDLGFHGVNLDSIVYGFYDGRLYTVILYFSRQEDFQVLYKTFQGGRGPVARKDDVSRKAFWDGSTVTLLLSFDEAVESDPSRPGAGRVVLTYKPIQTEMEVREGMTSSPP